MRDSRTRQLRPEDVASDLNLVVAIVLWNTVYLDRVIRALLESGKNIDERLLPHLSPLGWKRINLTGDYIWRQHKQVEQGKFRPLPVMDEAAVEISS
ncbi:Tn3 family transposase [Marinobacter sp. SS21]|nr:Tn3 family transposase [Marinobacter sp. SS21]MDC0663431.1 Tn3 family transposase [Marinobacter sp. SS21]